MNYSDTHVKECIDYLSFNVKEGYLDIDTAEDIIKRKAWNEVYEMMDKGDALANDNEREDENG